MQRFSEQAEECPQSAEKTVSPFDKRRGCDGLPIGLSSPKMLKAGDDSVLQVLVEENSGHWL